ncbi:MAG: mercuric transporter MerT family protein [Ottowia sp.]|uniref:mercuric transporter MerT family protein n=1 Tax=unclassified Ottowia TaxID=2645081 RepID=UPI003C2ECCA3
MPEPYLAAGEPQPQRFSGFTLAVAGLAALLASTCCVVPLVLAIIGVSGVWIGQLTRMAPYSYSFTALAVLALAVAGWLIWRPATQEAMACDMSCRKRTLAARRWFWGLVVLTLIPLAVRQLAPLFY